MVWIDRFGKPPNEQHVLVFNQLIFFRRLAKLIIESDSTENDNK